ncbi:MAG: hypothetical protein AMJ94_19815 [Deltaproteobacteria bacterium SM23_61]|nr:MAG: hypothetical protein AMJ94_19815 [Deltaproteobacteria bacterium SM23_61]
MKFSASSQKEEKNGTAEHAETAETYFLKDEKKESMYTYFLPSASSPISAVWSSFLLLGIQLFHSPNHRKMKIKA